MTNRISNTSSKSRPRRLIAILAMAMIGSSAPLFAETSTPATPNTIVGAANENEWIEIVASDLVVMTIARDSSGSERQIIIQLAPEPISVGWTRNVRKLARAGWYDGLAITRVQDNFVVQWGDPDGADEAKAKPLAEGLTVMGAGQYELPIAAFNDQVKLDSETPSHWSGRGDAYADYVGFFKGWPIAGNGEKRWPVHCYGYVGAGRAYEPDTGSGAELYAVIGHAPRQLDRIIAVVGRVIDGIEHLSSLPRGKGPIGFYTTPDHHVPIISVRMADDLPDDERPRYAYMSSESRSFAEYVEILANRDDAFYTQPAGGVDLCNVMVPVRRVGDQ